MSQHCRICVSEGLYVPNSQLMDHFQAGSVIPKGWRMCATGLGMHPPHDWKADQPTAPPAAGSRVHRVHPDDRRSPLARREGEPLEEEVRSSVKAILGLGGWLVDDFEQGWRRSQCPDCGAPIRASTRVTKGLPDLHVVGHGVEWWAELKRPGGALSDDQRDWIEARRSAGAFVYVVRSREHAMEITRFHRNYGRLPTLLEYRARTDPDVH